MPGRPTKAEELGLGEEIHEVEDGTFTATLTDSNENVVFIREGYSTRNSAHGGALRWINSAKGPGTPATRPRPTKPEPSSGAGQLLSLLRKRALDNDAQALRLRTQADLLQEEAKRLHAAADVLEGPEG